MKVVINTGPLVFLSRINRLTILKKFGSIFVPKGVISEIKYKQDDVSAAVFGTATSSLVEKLLGEVGEGKI